MGSSHDNMSNTHSTDVPSTSNERARHLDVAIDKDGHATMVRAGESSSSRKDPLLRAWTDYQLGDWHRLAEMKLDDIAKLDTRAELALLMSMAQQQLGNARQAHDLLEQSLRWGCTKRQAATLLISGIHHSLSCYAIARNDRSKAIYHLQKAVGGFDTDPQLTYKVRLQQELERLSVSGSFSSTSRSNLLADNGIGGHPTSLPQVTTKPTKSTLALVGTTIAVAGMRHSGSTALFNILRLALEEEGLAYKSFYSEYDEGKNIDDPDRHRMLIKIHELRDDVIEQADFIVTTRRDIRDCVASAKRRSFLMMEKMGGIAAYAKYNRALHDIWLPYSQHEFVYEAYMREPLHEINKLLKAFGFQHADASSVLSKIRNLPTDDYANTLLSPIHVTDPYRIKSHADTLTATELAILNREHMGWLDRYGYNNQQGAHRPD